MEEVDLVTRLTKRVGTGSLGKKLTKIGGKNLKREYNKLIKKLEEDKFKKEQDELNESYKQSKLNKKERDEKK
jgi:hypothetical protein